MKVRDYLRSHEALLRVEGSDTRVRVSGLDIVIRSIPSDNIRALLNEAVAHMLVRLEKNLRRSRLRFEQNKLEQLSLRIALHNLYIYTAWGRYVNIWRGGPGELHATELLKCQVPEQVMRYCQRHYEQDSRKRAAALLGYSEKELARWEAQRLPLRMCMNNSRYRSN
ncbi:hypothetical protein NK553_08775 [Pseudomonas sp. ZM23]|uniref:Uncharacterized protein n=1 Tax=Pseudomonas triclosanedens TaxID=2961893 RepID=A0ABY7A2W9_9PSED|nr:hypothetical protein [Pseudomonas triclosanedens]MCP8464037.1 hypothetical protein [Pseudomonas triclosanedens]MCP8469121.1 hypothetical protein [Pseudomonas triclosanedens]MCP8475843.1 hypothetical protein [Pseudomonas triclosanedens]WAI50454.1 hypothetical protein OU419_04075 [Pseudomonas triclosanedens]